MSKQVEQEARNSVLLKLREFAGSIKETDSRVQLNAKLKAAEIVLENTDESEVAKPFEKFMEMAKDFLANMDPNKLPTFGSGDAHKDDYPPNPLDGLQIEEEPEQSK